jgi:hypothetical protein
MITNIEDLREELAKTIERIKTEPRFVGQAVEINNAAGKMIASAKIQTEYMRMIKKPEEIAFMTPRPVKK